MIPQIVSEQTEAVLISFLNLWQLNNVDLHLVVNTAMLLTLYKQRLDGFLDLKCW